MVGRGVGEATHRAATREDAEALDRDLLGGMSISKDGRRIDPADFFITPPDCAVCGRPYRSHSGGSLNTCPIIATYRPKAS